MRCWALHSRYPCPVLQGDGRSLPCCLQVEEALCIPESQSSESFRCSESWSVGTMAGRRAGGGLLERCLGKTEVRDCR